MGVATAGQELDFLSKVLDKYGLIGVVVVGIIIIIILYYRNEAKKIDLEITKSTDMMEMREETKKTAGLTEQIQRENEINISEVKDMIKLVEAGLTRLENLQSAHGKSMASQADIKEIFNEIYLSLSRLENQHNTVISNETEIKTQLREISRDVNQK